MKRLITISLAAVLLFAGCAPKASISPSASPEAVVQAFLDSLDAGDISTCLNLLSDDVIFRQEPPGITLRGKGDIEAALRQGITWHQKYTITSPLNVEGDTVTLSARVSSDQFEIIGIDGMNASFEFVVRDGKIQSYTARPSNEGWNKTLELSSGGVGIKIDVEEKGLRVEALAKNSPALAAGIQPGDLVIAVNGLNYSEMREGEAALRISGKIGSKVSLTVLRRDSAPIEVEITRVPFAELQW